MVFFQTGDMEVKNPLFLDDPTPVRKNPAVKQQTATQQKQQQLPKQYTKPQNDDAKTSHFATKN